MRVSRWGNSLAVRIPAAVAEIMDLKEGDDIELRVVGDREVRFETKLPVADLLARLRKYRGSLPADFKFDREEANERR